jgi:predicted O-methyltransferase YrrM
MTSETITNRRERVAALGYDYAAQELEPVSSCNLCGGSSFFALARRDRYGYPAKADACERCGLVFLNPRPSAAAYARFYDGVYRPLVSAYHGRRIDVTTLPAEQRGYALERAAFLRPLLAGAGLETMIDIGGSTGVVAAHFAREFSLRGTLIDPAPLEVAEAGRLGLETIAGLVEDHDFGDRRFDLVLICQTVDHLLDVSGTLRRVRSLLTDRGLLFVDIVDFRAAYLRERSVEDAVKIDHPFSLTDATMRSFLARAGLHVVLSGVAADRLHLSYACRPGAPDRAALPAQEMVDTLLDEMRARGAVGSRQ